MNRHPRRNHLTPIKKGVFQFHTLHQAPDAPLQAVPIHQALCSPVGLRIVPGLPSEQASYSRAQGTSKDTSGRDFTRLHRLFPVPLVPLPFRTIFKPIPEESEPRSPFSQDPLPGLAGKAIQLSTCAMAKTNSPNSRTLRASKKLLLALCY